MNFYILVEDSKGESTTASIIELKENRMPLNNINVKVTIVQMLLDVDLSNFWSSMGPLSQQAIYVILTAPCKGPLSI